MTVLGGYPLQTCRQYECGENSFRYPRVTPRRKSGGWEHCISQFTIFENYWL